MTLEVNQSLQDQMITLIGNSSASNDPKQIPNDANDSLLKSAGAFAAGRTLGMSDEETLEFVSRQMRANSRAAAGSSAVTDPFTRLQQSAAQMGNVPTFAESPGVSIVDLDTANPVDDDQRFIPGDRGYKGPEAQEAADSRTAAMDKIKGERRDRYEKTRENRGLRVFKNQPTSLTNVYGSDERGEFGDLEGNVRTMSSDEQRADRTAMRVEAADLALAEAIRMSNAEMQEANFYRAQTEARAALRSGNMNDVNVSRPVSPSTFADAAVVNGVYVDPRSGLPIETSEPATTAIAGSNTPTSSQALNAPTSQSAIDFATAQVNTGQSDRAMPQVAIGQELNALDEAVAKLGQKANYESLRDFGQIRTLDALQKASDAIIAMSGAAGKKMVSVGPDGRPTVVQTTPGVAESLTTLGISPAQQERIGIALYQSDAAKSPGRAMADDVVRLDRPERETISRGGKMSEADIAIKRRSRGRFKTQGRETDPQLLSMAQSPFIGVEEGTADPRKVVYNVNDNLEDAVARKEAEFMAQDVFGDPKAVEMFSGFLEKERGRTPTIREVRDLMDARASTSPQYKPLDAAKKERARRSAEDASMPRMMFQDEMRRRGRI